MAGSKKEFSPTATIIIGVPPHVTVELPKSVVFVSDASRLYAHLSRHLCPRIPLDRLHSELNTQTMRVKAIAFAVSFLAGCTVSAYANSALLKFERTTHRALASTSVVKSAVAHITRSLNTATATPSKAE